MEFARGALAALFFVAGVLFLIKLVAFALMIDAIIDKNWPQAPR